MRYFTSDTHFGHSNIIKYDNRPFRDAGEMNRVIIERWNETVKPDDTVYHLGDVALCPHLQAQNIVQNLNGHKILIIGNHDRNKNKMHEMGFEEIYATLDIKLLDLPVRLCHYPYFTDMQHKFWQKFGEKYDHRNKGMWLLCGHVHDEWTNRNNMVNVGVTQWDYRPISENQLREFIAQIGGPKCPDQPSLSA